MADRGKELKALNTPKLGDSMLQPDGTPWMASLAHEAPKINWDDLTQIAALPLGSRLKTDPWDDKVHMLNAKLYAPMNARDKMPLEVTPVYFKLQRYEDANANPPRPGCRKRTGSTCCSPATQPGGQPASARPAKPAAIHRPNRRHAAPSFVKKLVQELTPECAIRSHSRLEPLHKIVPNQCTTANEALSELDVLFLMRRSAVFLLLCMHFWRRDRCCPCTSCSVRDPQSTFVDRRRLGSVFQPDYAGNGIAESCSQCTCYGVGAYVDLKFSRWVQVEGEGTLAALQPV